MTSIFNHCPADCLILKTSDHLRDENFYYFTKLDKFENQNGILILRKGKQPRVLTNILEYENLSRNKNFRAIKIVNKQGLLRVMQKLPKRIGLNYSAMTLSGMKNLRSLAKGKTFVDVSKHLDEVKAIKTIEEQRRIKNACRLAEEIAAKIENEIKPGLTERFVAQRIEELSKKLDVRPSFPTIVASGANSAVPHHVAGPTKLKKGVLLIDMGIVSENYCSDITRTFHIGHAPESVKATYASVKKAQLAALAAVREGIKASRVFAAANDILKKELNQSLIHGLGHGLGLEVHDFPEGFTEKSKTLLKKGMVFTLEPGYYKNYGIRIEDDLVVTKSGCKLFTTSPKELVEL